MTDQVVVVGFNFTALPLLLAQAGMAVDRIASIKLDRKISLE